MDVLFLSRLQFALTISFHYIYPPLNIGLSVAMVVMEALYLKTRNPIYLQMTKFWVRIFGLTFAIGVATGIVMEFEFGTNWATYSRYVGDVFGSALAAEGVFAFFLESGFLAVLLFGWNKVGPKMHFISSFLVMLGAHFSAVWIVVANSWQQTPAGYKIVGDGMAARAEITDFWAMVFNPSSMDRLSHVFMGAWQAGAFFILSVSAFYILKQKHVDFAKKSFKIGLALAFVASWGQLITGHSSAQGVAKNQPAKLAAFEGHFEKEAPGDLHLWGWVNEKERSVKGGVSLPGFLGVVIAGDRNLPVMGLEAFPESDWPPVNAVFQVYHGMVAVGMALIALATLGVFLLWRGTLFQKPWLLKVFVLSVLGPQIGNQLGWYAAELGRQPWIVQGLLRTSEGLSKAVRADMVLTSLIMFSFIYTLLFALFIYLLDDKIRHGPSEEDLAVPGTGGAPAAVLGGPRAEA